jgi:hypothetical protein
MTKRIKQVWMKINFKINYFLWKLKTDHTDEYYKKLTDEWVVKKTVEHISQTAIHSELTKMPLNNFDPYIVYVGEVNWDTWQSRINNKILEKELKSDKEHLGDQ